MINMTIDPIVQVQTRRHYEQWKRERVTKSMKNTIRTCNTCRKKVDSLNENVFKHSYYGTRKKYTTYMCKECHKLYKGRFCFSLIFEDPLEGLYDD
jgi:hypothetical protein